MAGPSPGITDLSKLKKVNAQTNRPPNPYPDHPDAKFVNGKWVLPGAVGPQGVSKSQVAAHGPNVPPRPKGGKLSKSAFQKWLASNAPGTAPDLPYDPTKGWPKAPALTAYPGLDTSTLPDGSEVPDTPAQAFNRTSASLLDPKQFANTQGTKAYQPIIDALTGQQSRLTAGIPQANQMLDSAYGAAGDAAARGADVVRNSNAQANQSMTDLAARLAQVAGGDPTAAAAVGQASANQQADNTRFANVAAQGQADQAAAAQRDLATAKLAYKGSTDSAISDLAQKVAGAKTEGSQAQGKAIEEALGFNSSQRTASLNRDVSSLEATTAAALAGPQITAGNLANSGTRQGLQVNAHNVAVNDWTNQTASTRQNWLDKVKAKTDSVTAQQMKTAMIAGKTPAVELALADQGAYQSIASALDQTWRTKTGPLDDPGYTYNEVIKSLHNTYPDSSSKAVKALALQYVSAQVPNWNKQHGNKYKIVNGVPVKVK